MTEAATQITLATEAETQAFAAQCASSVATGSVLALSGDLGAGKSVFARALIRALAGDPTLEVPSPTFTLVQTYDTPAGPVWHFDLYRLKEADEVYELGWDDALADGIVIVEWPERLGGLLPPGCRTIEIIIGDNGARHLTISA